MRRSAVLVSALAAALALAGCFDVKSADLFLLTRTGQGSKLTLLVSDGGTVACDGRAPKALNDQLLIAARDLADNLAADAARNLRLPVTPGTIFTYTLKLQGGTVTFSDHDTAHHPILAQAEVFAAEAAQQSCNLN